MEIHITDDHLENLEITDNSVLLVRMPGRIIQEQTIMIRKSLQKCIQEKTGMNPGLLFISNDVEVSTLDAETLRNLKAEIDQIILNQSTGKKD